MSDESLDPYLDEQYDARGWAGNADETIAQHQKMSAKVWRKSPPEVVRFGNSDSEVADVFPGAGGAPVLFVVHGGYWKGSSRQDVSFLAAKDIANGACVVVIDYPLAPGATLEEIMASVRSAYQWVCSQIDRYGGDPERIAVIGHSAGAHLIASLLNFRGEGDDWCAPRHLLGVSGLYDLRPLMQTSVNSWLHLDPTTAERASPGLSRFMEPLPESVIVAGANESPEFRHQSDEFARRLEQGGAKVTRFDIDGTGHFDVLDALSERGLLEMCTEYG